LNRRGKSRAFKLHNLQINEMILDSMRLRSGEKEWGKNIGFVILGGGFGGLAAAQKLNRAPFEVTLN